MVNTIVGCDTDMWIGYRAAGTGFKWEWASGEQTDFTVWRAGELKAVLATSAPTAVFSLTSAGSCFDCTVQTVTCDVDESTCTGGGSCRYWYAPGYVSMSSGCCHCKGSCDHALETSCDTGHYYDQGEARDPRCAYLTTDDESRSYTTREWRERDCGDHLYHTNEIGHMACCPASQLTRSLSVRPPRRLELH